MFSSDGKLFFDANSLSYRLYEKQVLIKQGSGSTPYSPINQFYFETTIPSPNGQPLIFVKPTGTTSGIGGTTIDGAISVSVNKTGTDYEYVIYTRDTLSGGATTLTCYVFVPGCVAATGYGINVYTEDGKVAFSTRDRLLKIAGYYVFPYQTIYAHPENLPSTLLSYGSVPASYALGVGNAGWAVLDASTVGIVFGLGSYIRSDGNLGHSVSFVIANISPVGNFSVANGNQYVPIIDTSLYD
jgi:hypothetical protein